MFKPHFCIFILAYVDIIIIIGVDAQEVQNVIISTSTFASKDLGSVQYFLGIEVSLTESGSLHLSQGKYITDLLEHAGMTNDKSISTPTITNAPLSSKFGDPIENASFYRIIVLWLELNFNQ